MVTACTPLSTATPIALFTDRAAIPPIADVAMCAVHLSRLAGRQAVWLFEMFERTPFYFSSSLFFSSFFSAFILAQPVARPR